MAHLTGRTALVTGGTRGIGLAIGRRLAEDGARVALVGRGADSVKTAAEELSAAGHDVLGIVADVTADADIARAVAEAVAWAGGLDILVNNAGIAEEAAFADMTRESWERVLTVNLTAPFLFTQRAVTVMKPGSSVVNISSVDAHGADGPYASYIAAKAGLVGLTKSAAVELAAAGIRVNSVSPGWVHTDMAAEAVGPQTLAYMQQSFARVPMRRLITTDEVAHAVSYLAGPGASGITGVDLLVDGGTLANLYILETLPDAGGEAQS
ncbi:SDR family NAD(P)-dependent oxidoreductase [Streptomyces cacaoi]|uniref:SDR family NAD(P)-dependent oxidoreductase n=1 Tax=Streptomyces cacaoi TaxID=1898 RepID=UPI003748E7BC